MMTLSNAFNKVGIRPPVTKKRWPVVLGAVFVEAHTPASRRLRNDDQI